MLTDLDALKRLHPALVIVFTALPALEKAAHDTEPLIAEHARWAISEIQTRQSNETVTTDEHRCGGARLPRDAFKIALLKSLWGLRFRPICMAKETPKPPTAPPSASTPSSGPPPSRQRLQPAAKRRNTVVPVGKDCSASPILKANDSTPRALAASASPSSKKHSPESFSIPKRPPNANEEIHSKSAALTIHPPEGEAVSRRATSLQTLLAAKAP